MTLVDLMHPHKERHIDDSTRHLALGDTLTVNRNDAVKIHAAWPAHSQYGLSAFVVSDFGHVDVISLDGYGHDKPVQSAFKGMVKHTGQTIHGFPKHTEQTIETRFIDRIRILVPIVHTKQFGANGCALDDNLKMRITNEKGLDVSLSSTTKPSSKQIYAYSPCIIRNGPDGLMVHSWEKYSEPATIFDPVYDMERHEFRLDTKTI